MNTEAVITLFLNAGEAKKQLDQFREKVETVGKEIKSSLTGSFAGLLGTGSVIYGFKKLYDNIRAVADASERFHLPVQELSLFQAMMVQVGGSSEEALNAIGKIEQAIVELRTTASGPLLTVGNQVGLSLYRKDGEFKNSFEIFDELRKKFKGLNDDAQIKVATELGLADPASLRLLRMSDQEFEHIREEAQKFATINAKTVAVMRRVQNATKLLEQTLMSGGYTFLDGVHDALKKLNISFDNSGKYLESFQKLMKFLGAATGIAVRALYEMGEGLGKAVFFIQRGIGDVLISVKEALKLIIEGVSLFAQFCVEFGEGVISFLKEIPGFVQQTYEALKGFADKILSSLGGVWDSVFEKAKTAFDNIASYFKEKWEKIKSFLPDFLLGEQKEAERGINASQKGALTPEQKGCFDWQKPVFNMLPTPAEKRVEQDRYSEEHVREVIKEHQTSYMRAPMKPVFNITINGGDIGQVQRALNKAIYNGTNSVVPA